MSSSYAVCCVSRKLASWSADRADSGCAVDTGFGNLLARRKGVTPRLSQTPPGARLGIPDRGIVRCQTAAHGRLAPDPARRRLADTWPKGEPWPPAWTDAVLAWWPAEQDLRGYDEQLGWVHAVAHGADAVGALGFAGPDASLEPLLSPVAAYFATGEPGPLPAAAGNGIGGGPADPGSRGHGVTGSRGCAGAWRRARTATTFRHRR
ncbi:DUF2785 domain-containing protein [Flexivirga sp. ID2601S]|uniref:DUF2785 domain-containing protein n=1 Tax=Flexivirga aerilata TaxID=1656889 RepID=A0A849ADQ4_9MICO|nr:DUF2785 domain-containing protein [Flexivirga aerilata]